MRLLLGMVMLMLVLVIVGLVWVIIDVMLFKDEV